MGDSTNHSCNNSNNAIHHNDPNVKFDPPKRIVENSYVKSFEEYQRIYDTSINDPAAFWGEIADQFHWESRPTSGQFMNYNFDVRKGPIFIKWMEGAKTNISYNVLDRHVNNGLGSKIAFFW